MAEGSRLEAVYRQHGPAATRLAYLLTGDADLAHDLTQEAFVKLAGGFKHLRSADSVRAYLNRIIVNLSKDHFRRAKVERSYLASRRAERAPTTDPVDVEGRSSMMTALEALGHRQRAAVVLRFYEDMTEPQIANAMGLSTAAARSLLARAMKTLRNEMEGDER